MGGPFISSTHEARMQPYRFSLRSLLIAMLAAGVGLGMLVRWGQALDERARVLTRVQLIHGARLTWPPPPLDSDDEEIWMRWSETQVQSHVFESDHFMVSCDSESLAGRRLGAIWELRSIVLIRATDDDLRGLVGIDRLEDLLLVDYGGTANGLRSLSAHNRLSGLGVSGRLTAAELEAIGSIPAIHSVWLDFKTVDLGTPATASLIEKALQRVEQGNLPCVVQPLERKLKSPYGSSQLP